MTKCFQGTSNAKPDRRVFIQFRLLHVFYAVTLLATSFGAFGTPGLLLGAYVLLMWAGLFLSPPRVKLVVTTCAIVLASFCLGYRDPPRMPSYRAQCANRVKQIALALNLYCDDYGSFPPAYIPDSNGAPLHSWRVLLLPYLDQSGLFDEYDFDEAWNGPNNRKLLGRRPQVYSCPGNTNRLAETDTNSDFVAVVGSRTVWPGPVGRKTREISDATSATLLIVEASAEGIPWTKPQDLTIAEAIPLLTSIAPERTGGHQSEGFFTVQFSGRCVATVDGRTEFVPYGFARNDWLRLLTIDDGTCGDGFNITPTIQAPRNVKVGVCFRFGAWIVVVLLPPLLLSLNVLRRQSG